MVAGMTCGTHGWEWQEPVKSNKSNQSHNESSQVCSSPMPSLGRGHGTWIGKAWQKVEILGIENSKLRGGGSGTSEDPSLHKLVGSMVRAR